MRRFVLLIVVLWGCAIDRTGESGSHRLLQRIDTTRERQRALEDDLSAEVGRVDGISRGMEEARSRIAEGGATLDTFVSELQALRGELANLRHDLQEGSRRAEDVDFALSSAEARLLRLETHLKLEPSSLPTPAPVAPPARTPTTTGSTVSAVPSPAPAEAAVPQPDDLITMVTGGQPPSTGTPDDAAFADALFSVKAQEWSQSGGKLQKYLKKYPEGSWVLEAQYLVGQCLFELGRHKASIQEFEKVISRDNKGPWAPRAMFMQGLAFLEMGTSDDIEAAQVFFEDVIRKFPKSVEAERARRKLEQLR